jgi:hypothetical protein
MPARAADRTFRGSCRGNRESRRLRTVDPDLERFFAERMGATAYELDSSHVPMLSQPERVIDVIRTAAKAVQAATVAA